MSFAMSFAQAFAAPLLPSGTCQRRARHLLWLDPHAARPYELNQTSSQGDFFMAGMSIGEVARKMGLRSSAIRYYERLGLIPKVPRVSGRRRYDERVLERLAMVRFAKHVGFSVAEIKVLLSGVEGRPPTERWRKLAAEKVAQVDQFVAQARSIRNLLSETLDFQCPKLVERGRALPASKHPGLRLNRRAKS